MARILRGEIRWADLHPTRGREQAGQRPVLILSNDIFNERSGTVIAVALTSQPQRAGFPLTLELNRRLVERYVEPGGTLILGAYGSYSKQEAARDIATDIAAAGLRVAGSSSRGVLP